MITGPSAYANAIGAYRAASRAVDLDPGASAAALGEPAPQDDFAGMVREAVRSAATVAETGESQAMAAVTDSGADLSTVVTAVAEAEVTLRAVVAVRDKVIEAYREVIRMPV